VQWLSWQTGQISDPECAGRPRKSWTRPKTHLSRAPSYQWLQDRSSEVREAAASAPGRARLAGRELGRNAPGMRLLPGSGKRTVRQGRQPSRRSLLCWRTMTRAVQSGTTPHVPFGLARDASFLNINMLLFFPRSGRAVPGAIRSNTSSVSPSFGLVENPAGKLRSWGCVDSEEVSASLPGDRCRSCCCCCRWDEHGHPPGLARVSR